LKLKLRAALLTLAAIALGGIANPASAEPYPAKPIRFVAKRSPSFHQYDNV
jgi:tripartite-type tricarboxylate transporter receptor subunit TctC